jgi:hypothetical protein
MTHPATRWCIILLLDLQNKFGWKGWRQWFMFALQSVLLTFMRMRLNTLDKNPIFPQTAENRDSGEASWRGQKRSAGRLLQNHGRTRRRKRHRRVQILRRGVASSASAPANNPPSTFILPSTTTVPARYQCYKTFFLHRWRCRQLRLAYFADMLLTFV